MNDNHGNKIIYNYKRRNAENSPSSFRAPKWLNLSRMAVLITVSRDRLFREGIIQIALPAIAFGSFPLPPSLSRLLLGL